jgi:hypothetical protein
LRRTHDALGQALAEPGYTLSEVGVRFAASPFGTLLDNGLIVPPEGVEPAIQEFLALRTMMNLLSPVGWGDVATRRDVELLEERLDHKIDSSFTSLDHRIDSVADRLDRTIDLIDARLEAMTETMTGMATKADVIESCVELQRTQVTWIFAAQATVVAAVGLLIAYLR